jgi:imidazole glycerol-phosphate synthase subunit HisH
VNPTVGLIDYGSGNLRSVSKALENQGATVQLVQTGDALLGVDAVLLPGVGAFGDSVSGLEERGLFAPIADWLAADKPFLGICLGYQLLFESSEETPDRPGFGFFKGRVRRFEERGLKIPHMGWNTLTFTQPDNPLWKNLPDDAAVYFVHSYFPDPADPTIVAATCDYGETFAASVSRGRVSATQFHPEKSQTNGLTILGNFLNSI